MRMPEVGGNVKIVSEKSIYELKKKKKHSSLYSRPHKNGRTTSNWKNSHCYVVDLYLSSQPNSADKINKFSV